MSLFGLRPGFHVQFDYTNHEGKFGTRTVLFQSLDFGSNEWYPEPQWFLSGMCLERRARRSFALAKIDGSKVRLV